MSDDAWRTMLDAALEYAEHGVPVFPVWGVVDGQCACGKADCKNPGKHPLGAAVPNGVKDATADPAKIREWWTRFPAANLATPTSWAIVLDVDPRNGGDETLAELERQHGPLPETAEVLTGGGGRHLYFAPVLGLGPSAGKVGTGLDVKAGVNAYVLVPPSSHVNGRRYCDEVAHPLFETPVAPMPAWLLARALAPASSQNGEPSEATDWAALLAGAPVGERHDVSVRIAGHLLGRQLPPAEVEVILMGFATRCTPPHDAADVRRIVRDLSTKEAAKHSPPKRGEGGGGLGLVSVGELLGEPDETHAWLVSGRLPAGGLGALVGKPKAGKTTIARCLAFAVARGAPWLGFDTRQGPVLYLALEEKRAEVREHFRDMGATASDPLFILCAAAPLDALARLRVEADRRRPVLIIIDPLFRFVRVEDGNDYATMTAALEPLLTLARETGAHVLLVHHLGKGGRVDGDAILGSTAIFGAVDVALLLRRTERYRTLSSIQRYGEDLEEMTIRLDPVTRNVEAGLPRVDAEIADAGRLILQYLAGVDGPVTEADLDGVIECRRQAWARALRNLVASGRVVRTGRGGKGDPFRYCGSLIYTGTRELEDVP